MPAAHFILHLFDAFEQPYWVAESCSAEECYALARDSANEEWYPCYTNLNIPDVEEWMIIVPHSEFLRPYELNRVSRAHFDPQGLVLHFCPAGCAHCAKYAQPGLTDPELTMPLSS